MYYKKTEEWVKWILWVCVAIAILFMAYALWQGYMYLSIATFIVLLVLLAFLAYCKYTEVMAIKRKFTVVQETFTTLMLVYFSYTYFADSKALPGEKQLTDARKKFDAVYDKSRYSLTMPLMMTAIKTFGEIKNIKDIVISEIKNFSSFDGFNLDNAESLTNEIGKLATKLGQMGDIVSEGFSKSRKSIDEIANEAPKPRTKALAAPEEKSRSTGRKRRAAK